MEEWVQDLSQLQENLHLQPLMRKQLPIAYGKMVYLQNCNRPRAVCSISYDEIEAITQTNTDFLATTKL